MVGHSVTSAANAARAAIGTAFCIVICSPVSCTVEDREFATGGSGGAAGAHPKPEGGRAGDGAGAQAAEGGALGEAGHDSGGATGNGKSNGAACADADECASGICSSEGVCCDSDCTGQCESCLSKEARGRCVAVTTPRTPCEGSGPCAGFCDGVNATTCVFPDATTSCGTDASCSDDTAETAAVCDGDGGCTPSLSVSCEFGCDAEGSACADNCPPGEKPCDDSCIPDEECCGGCAGSAPVCDNGSCVARPNGEECSTNSECASRTCSAEGVCCNAACTGQCESCLTASSRGTCVAVTTPRTSCNGSGACAGHCDGINRTSCAYPGAETLCSAASCTNGSARSASVCNGGGNCTSPTTMACTYDCEPGGNACSTCRPKSEANLLPNPGFDGSSNPWEGLATYSTQNDADFCAGSGSLAILNISAYASTCLAATPNTTYYVTYQFKVYDGVGNGYCTVVFYPEAECEGTSASEYIEAWGPSSSEWTRAVTAQGVSPAGTASMSFSCIGGVGFGYYDQLYLGTENTTF